MSLVKDLEELATIIPNDDEYAVNGVNARILVGWAVVRIKSLEDAVREISEAIDGVCE